MDSRLIACLVLAWMAGQAVGTPAIPATTKTAPPAAPTAMPSTAASVVVPTMPSTEAEPQIIPPHPVLGNIHPALMHMSEKIINRRHIPLQNCNELQEYGFTKSGLYVIQLGKDGVECVVYCDMSVLGGGWTVIQRRVNGNLDFQRKFGDYKRGFGDMFENFWLGLEKIHRLTTSSGTMELYIGLESFNSRTATARYSKFAVDTEENGYALRISHYDTDSTAGDSLGNHNGQMFSARDIDRDTHEYIHCARLTKGGWWYRDCHDSNLNGVWYTNGILENKRIPDGIIWQHWLGNYYSLKTTVLAIRPVK